MNENGRIESCLGRRRRKARQKTMVVIVSTLLITFTVAAIAVATHIIYSFATYEKTQSTVGPIGAK